MSAAAWTTVCAGLWRGRRHFSVLDTGGSGHDSQGLSGFLRLWQAWRRDPARCERLHVLLLVGSAARAGAALHAATAPTSAREATLRAEPQPAFDADLLTQLHTTWPPLTPNLHPLHLDDGRVQLLLGLGPLQALLPRLRLQAGAVWLAGAAEPAPGQAPGQRLRVLKAVARLTAPDALACGAASSPGLLAELRTAGFQQADEAPSGQVWARHRPHGRRHPLRSAAAASADPLAELSAETSENRAAAPPRTAIVIGAGVAGAAAAQALARHGLSVTVLDRQTQPATETSGNPAALFHGTVNPDDGLYARLFRAAALVAQRSYASACTPRAGQAPVGGQVQGLLRLQPIAGEAESQVVQQMRAQLQQLGLPPAYVQALDTAAASALAGLPLGAPAWFYPGGGWVDPAAWVRQVMHHPGVRFQGDTAVQALRQVRHAHPVQGERQPEHQGQWQWQALDADGRVLAQADVLVLCCAVQSQRLLQDIAPALHWPLRQTRGQVTQLQTAGPAGQPMPAKQPLRLPVAGDGYALPLSAPGHVLCGATRQAASAQDRPGPFKLQTHIVGDDSARRAADLDDLDGATPTAADHRLNLQRLQRLTGLQPEAGGELRGRVGWRLHSDDRLPIAGAVPLDPAPVAVTPEAGSGVRWPVRVDQARHWPRVPGLFVLTALGARGLTLAPLLGELVAAQATGTPWPLEQELADAVDPVRWALRAARALQAQAQAQARAVPPRDGPTSARHTRPA